MRYVDWTGATPEENLACDEVLLEECESGRGGDLLRLWAPQQHFVVLGYANRVAEEADAAACARLGVPILRRCSGGGTVLQGPGALNYSVILEIDEAPHLASISATNDFVMERHRALLSRLLGKEVSIAGHTDLAIDGVKCSGNAQRRKRRFLLFHGAFLLHLNLGLVEECLRLPPRQPAYRQNRAHRDFIANLPLSIPDLKTGLREAWQAREPLETLPIGRISELARGKYATPEWNLKF